MIRYLTILMLCALAACANTAGKPLPLVDSKDPTWPLVADHLEMGSLPR